MIKKTKKSQLTLRKRFIWSLIAILIGIGAAIVIGYLVINTVTAISNSARKERIATIYQSLKLDESYTPVKVDIFGEKRVYEWDKGRSYSSSIQYVHGDTTGNTVTELDRAIKNAGFEFIDEPYPGSFDTQYHYKSGSGEYIRLTVSNKASDDEFENNRLMGKSLDQMGDNFRELAKDKNKGPANVTIKVNLDDNNE